MYFMYKTVSYTLACLQTQELQGVKVSQMDLAYPQGPGKQGNKPLWKLTEAWH